MGGAGRRRPYGAVVEAHAAYRARGVDLDEWGGGAHLGRVVGVFERHRHRGQQGEAVGVERAHLGRHPPGVDQHVVAAAGSGLQAVEQLQGGCRVAVGVVGVWWQAERGVGEVGGIDCRAYIEPTAVVGLAHEAEQLGHAGHLTVGDGYAAQEAEAQAIDPFQPAQQGGRVVGDGCMAGGGGVRNDGGIPQHGRFAARWRCGEQRGEVVHAAVPVGCPHDGEDVAVERRLERHECLGERGRVDQALAVGVAALGAGAHMAQPQQRQGLGDQRVLDVELAVGEVDDRCARHERHASQRAGGRAGRRTSR